MFNEAAFPEMLLPSSGNVNDSVVHIYRKYADLNGTEYTWIELRTWVRESCAMRLIQLMDCKVLRTQK